MKKAENINKAQKPNLRLGAVSCSVPSDVLELLSIIARSDNAMYREEARRLIRRYCN